MKKVFVGGSRNVKCLSPEVQQGLDRIIEKSSPVLIGDANGVDKAIQKYFKERNYNNVEVFCMEGICRNNIGPWATRSIPALDSKKDFSYYTTKDRVMAEEASAGFMIWDGKSIGTLTNVFRLISQDKKVIVYTVPSKKFSVLKNKTDWDGFFSLSGKELRDTVEKGENIELQKYRKPSRRDLFFENMLPA